MRIFFKWPKVVKQPHDQGGTLGPVYGLGRRPAKPPTIHSAGLAFCGVTFCP